MGAETETSKGVTGQNGGVGRLCEELNREDSELRSHLLDAALAGLQLTRHPESQEFRREATKVWGAIEPVLSHHLAAEDTVMMLAWLERYGRISPEMLSRIRECHQKLKQLAGAIETSHLQSVTEEAAVEVGRALCGLAVCLDDVIDSEEHRIFPAIHKALFEVDRSA